MNLHCRNLLFLGLMLALCVPAMRAQQRRSLDDDSLPAKATEIKKEPAKRGPRAISVLEWVPKEVEVPAAIATAASTPGATPGATKPGAATPGATKPGAATAAPSATQAAAPATPSQAARVASPIQPAAARLVPVSVFYGGEFQDAGVYLSQPAPLAVRAKNVYVVEQAGDPLGFFTVNESTRESDEWYGFGAWSPLLPGEDPIDRTADYAHPGVPKSKKVKIEDEDDDRPTLRKKKPQVKGKHPQPVEKVEIPDPSADPDRPRLHHKEAEDDTLPELTGLPANMRQASAVSDASTMDEHVFSHAWSSPAEAAAAQKQMEQLAMTLVTKIPVQHAAVNTAVGAQAQPADSGVQTAGRPKLHYTAPADKTAPSSAKTKSTKRKKPAPALPLALMNVRFAAYDLAYQEEPTYVLTAETNEPEATRRYVAVIAVPDIYGKLQVAWSSATGVTQLDIAPVYRLIDAVDANGDGRAEVLLESRDQSARRFCLYEVYRGVARQLFATGPIS